MKIIGCTNIREYFKESVESAISNQHTNVSSETSYYIVNVLTQFCLSENLFTTTPTGPQLEPLITWYNKYVEATNIYSKYTNLKQLGDVALFISGIFSYSLNRKIVDVEYYNDMGASAYGILSQLQHSHAKMMRESFAELSNQFIDCTEILAEVGENINTNQDDILRLYELYLRTGSTRAKNKLNQHGITPITTPIQSN
jgi:hypothetical protein